MKWAGACYILAYYNGYPVYRGTVRLSNRGQKECLMDKVIKQRDNSVTRLSFVEASLKNATRFDVSSLNGS